MAQHTLGALALPSGMVWVDEFDWRPVAASFEYGVTGAAMIDVMERESGRPITLQSGDDRGWVKRSVLETLHGLAADPDAVFALALADGRIFDVMFAPDNAVAARQVSVRELPTDDWPYVVTLRLIEI